MFAAAPAASSSFLEKLRQLRGVVFAALAARELERVPRYLCLFAGLLLIVPSCEPQLIVGKYGGGSAGGGTDTGGTDTGGTDIGGTDTGGTDTGGTDAGGVAGESSGGSPSCEPPRLVQGQGGEGGAPVTEPSGPVTTPWSTSFENGLCDYADADGYCYIEPLASAEIVTSPVRSGKFAAAYTVNADGTRRGYQSRCVRGGALPEAAFYSAYFFIPEAPSEVLNWNLIHLRGIDNGSSHGLWDVSVRISESGALRVFIFDHLRQLVRDMTSVPDVPVGAWFQLEVYWKRAADATGELTVYQDGAVAFELTGLITDDSTIGEWYVGNLAGALTPAVSTIYVDDVAIREAP